MSTRRRRHDPSPLRDLLPGLMKQVRGSGRGAVESVRSVWPEIVGAATAQRTRIAAVENGRLRVQVASAALKHDLATFRRQEVLAELRKRLPELRIREVSYRVGTVP